MSAEPHRSDPRILGRRTLHQDHRVLAGLLRPGLAVLDVGCGTGAITAGIAQAVGPGGSVVGIDRDEALLEVARGAHAAVPNLRFEGVDAAALGFDGQFDIVTAARTLQWIADPALAVSRMKEAAKPGGAIVVLDYNHAHNRWEPEPGREFQRFYEAFLAWRRANGWDNEMAAHLPELFRSAGLVDVESVGQDEIVERGEADFDVRTAIWPETIESVSASLAGGGYCTRGQLEEARRIYDSWRKTELRRQTLAMGTVIGTVPVA